MASKTKATKIKRKHKKAGMGKKRKASLRSKGSTKSSDALFSDK